VEAPLDTLSGGGHDAGRDAPAAAPLHVAPPPPGASQSLNDAPYGEAYDDPYAGTDPLSADADPRARSDALEVGDIPDLPPIWKTYRKPISAFVGVAAVVLVGVFTHLFTPWGAFGIPGAVEWALSEPPPPAPEPPPPPPPRVANPEEVAALFDEGTYEAYRSILATVKAAGPTLPDNRIAAAKAQTLGALAYGTEVFPLAEAQAAVDALEGIDLASTRFDSAADAEIEVLEARAALGLLNGNGEAFIEPLTEAAADHPERADVWWLLGLTQFAAGRVDDAVAAERRALEYDPKHARAHAALGRMVGADDPAAAAAHYDRALEAAPELAFIALEAADAFERAEMYGSARRARRTAARAAERGLPPAQRAPLLLEVVNTYDALGRIDEVIPLAREAARLQPAQAEYVAAGALADVADGKADAAVATLDALLQREPSSAPALIARARARFAQEDVAKAFIDLEAARTAAPKDPRIPLWEGRFNLELGKTSDAETALLRAVRLSDADPTPTLELGRAELEAGDVESALGRAEAAVAMAPEDPRAHVLAGEVYVRRGQIDRALAEFRRAGALDRYNLDAKLGEANMLRERAEREEDPGASEDLSRATELYTEALDDAPDDPRVLFEYGRALELSGEEARALELYEKAAASDGSDPRPHLRMAAAFLERETPDVARARSALDVAREIERETGKQLTEVRYWEARVGLREGQIREAISSMRQAVEKEPRNANYHYWLGRALEKNGSLYEAIASYEQAVTLNSRFAAAQRALGWTELERHRFSEARKWFARYRETAPHDASIWVDIGESWVRQNRDDKALAAFQKALAADAEDARALLHVGNILSRKGQERAALQRFEQVVARDPDHGEAWCLIGISRSQRRVTREARAALDRCLELESAPPDLQEMARNIIETPSR
jgi:tetratricopeptide (TPR) repeat protein